MNTPRSPQRASSVPGYRCAAVHVRRCTTVEEKGDPDVEPVVNFALLVITALEFPYRRATAACAPGRRAAHPDRRRLVLHSFGEQDPPISYTPRRGSGYIQREMYLLCFAYVRSVCIFWQKLLGGFMLFDTRHLAFYHTVGLVCKRPELCNYVFPIPAKDDL